MKKNLLSILAITIFNSLIIHAQPVITAAGYNPKIGDKYKLQETKIISTIPILSGANLIWDFRNLIDSGSGEIISFISPLGQKGSDSFPSANIILIDSSIALGAKSTSKSYFQTNSSLFAQVGVIDYDSTNGNLNFYNKYVPAFPYMIYPMTFNTIYSDSCQLYYLDRGGWFSSYTIFDSLIGIGYGTLKLPNITYSNVLCVNILGTYWFVSNGIHWPLLLLNPSRNNIGKWTATYISGIPLPIEISSFTASWQNKMPYLKWNADNTSNTKQFDVQRSLDGRSFLTVGQVSASDRSNYRFSDNYMPTSTVYYRLQQVDKNGQTFYSNIVQLTVSDKQFSIYPNPAQDFEIISFNRTIDKATIEVNDITGKVVITQTLNSTNTYKLNTQTLKNGFYLIKVNTTTGSYNEKLIISK
jgi:hypothetical protein